MKLAVFSAKIFFKASDESGFKQWIKGKIEIFSKLLLLLTLARINPILQGLAIRKGFQGMDDKILSLSPDICGYG